MLLQGVPSPRDTAVVRSTVAAAAMAGEAVALSLAPDSLAESPSACTAPPEPAACAEGAQAADQSAALANAAHKPADSAATALSASGAGDEAAMAAVALNPYAEAQCVSIALSHSAAGAMVDLSTSSAHRSPVHVHVAATVGQATATSQAEHVQAMTAELIAGVPASATAAASSVMDEAHCDDSSKVSGNGTAALGQPLAAGLGCPTGEYPAMGTKPTLPSPAKSDSTAKAAPAEAAATALVSTASVAVAAEVTADTSVTATAMGASLPDADAARRDALQHAVATPAPLQLRDDSWVPRLTRSGVWLVMTTPSVCLG